MSSTPQQLFGAPQPINTVTTSTETAYAGGVTATSSGGKSHEQQKERFTRAERRAFTKEKKGKQDGKKPAHQKDVRKKDFKGAAGPASKIKSIDDVIAFLLTIRGKQGVEDAIAYLLTVRSQGGGNSKSLESRITKDAPKTAEPSAKKLEKLQKRKEIRAERRQTKLAIRAEQAEQGAQAAEAGPAAKAPVQEQVEEQETNFEDEINYDEL
jgi:hypothetical protein